MPSTTEPELRHQVALAGRLLALLGQTDGILGFVGVSLVYTWQRFNPRTPAEPAMPAG